MRRPSLWRSGLTALTVAAIGVGTLFATAMPASAASESTAVSTATADATFTGYTDKDDLRTSGRAIVASGELPVTDGSAPSGTGTTYYVDSASGDDTADGTSPETAWQSFDNVNATVFQPGDRILLKAGSVWQADGDTVATEAYDYTTWSNGVGTDVVGADATALLAPQGSGTEEDPIVLSSYGDGAAPELDGRGTVNDVLQLTNQEHWDISNLEITNETDGFDASTYDADGLAPGQENPLTGDLRGIHVQGESAGVLTGFEVHDVFVHDVSGVTWSVTGAGVDRSKRTGGIVFEGLKGDGVTASQLEGIVVRDSVIANTSFANIAFRQFSGMGTWRYQNVKPGWGDRAVATASTTGVITEDSDWRPLSDVQISGNYLSNRDTTYGWDAMYLTSVQNATVEGNLIDGAGVSGIEMYWADDILIQDNEVAEVEGRTDAADSNGIDPDRGTSNILIQGNYIHDGGEGILLCGFSFGTAVVRYNIIADVDRNYVNPHGDKGVNVVYNNLMYNDQQGNSSTIGFFRSSGTASSYLKSSNLHYVLNNVFVNRQSSGVTGSEFQTDYPGVTFSNNSYSGVKISAPSADADAITTDPQLIGDPQDDIADAAIGSVSSPLIAAGTSVDLSTLVPGFAVTGQSDASQVDASADFFGASLSTPPTVGATSYAPAAGNGVIAGDVLDEWGDPVPGAAVDYGSQSVTADDEGHYAIELGAGSYTLTPTATDYAPGDDVAVTLAAGQTLRTDLTLGETTTTVGTVTGTVTSGGSAVENATVALSQGGETVTTTTTDTAGAYTFSDVPAAVDYAVDVTKEGYQQSSTSDVTVAAARTTTIDVTLSRDPGATDYAIDETFDDETTGTFTGTADGVLAAKSSSAGTLSIVDDPDRSGNKYLDISKTASGNLAVYTADEQNLTGTVTIEARIKRTTTNTSANQVGMYSYTGTDWNASAPWSSTNPAATFALSGGKIITHNVTGSSQTVAASSYAAGQWYTIRNVVDLDTGTFDFYVNDMTTPVLVDQPLRTQVAELDYFSFFSNSSNVGDMLVDYFRVNTGLPYDYDDSALGSVDVQTADGPVTLTASADGSTYSGTVDPFTDEVTVAATSDSPFASVSVNGSVLADGETTSVPLDAGQDEDAVITTDIPVVVTAEDGSTTSYTISVSRTNPSQSTQLRDLSVVGYELTPAFASDQQGTDVPYALTETLDSSVTSVQLAWELGWAGQSVQVDGEDVPAGTAGTTVDLQPGENTIEITSSSFAGDFGTYVITVDVADPQPTSVTVAGASSVATGEATTLTATVEPADAEQGVTWASSDTAVATVSSSGVVTGASEGTAVITATSVAAEDVQGSVSITVLPAAWSASTVYTAGDRVSYDGAVYVAQWWTQGETPGSTSYGAWAEIGAATECTAGTTPAWTSSWIYTGGETVVYDGKRWQAKWWTRNQTPGDVWGPWTLLDAC
ncbi:MAG: carboxypeptidase regulatory-like domain-containing protein [Microbacterium sp.]|uniref:carboxypeptidase regulatory-like domain-containing protein n=1 Tax=Microbacterium sp. TaxID=51671 RepID=UPI0039E30E63